jgi:TRAP-type uncharacterized transport system fused permease subunit
LQGDLLTIVFSATTAIIAMWILASALEGYLYFVGIIAWPIRLVLLVAACVLIVPEWRTDLIGLALILGVYIVVWFTPSLRRPVQASAVV